MTPYDDYSYKYYSEPPPWIGLMILVACVLVIVGVYYLLIIGINLIGAPP